MFEHSGDPGPAGLDFPLVDLDLQQACQVPGQFPARLQGTPGRIAVVVLRLGIRSVLKQQFGYFRTSQESGRVQGGPAIPGAAVDRGPVLQHPIDGFDPAGQGRPYQGSQPECRVHPVDVGPVLEVPSHGGEIPVPGRAPDTVHLGPGRLGFNCRCHGPAADPVERGNDGHQPEQERQQHAAKAVGEH